MSSAVVIACAIAGFVALAWMHMSKPTQPQGVPTFAPMMQPMQPMQPTYAPMFWPPVSPTYAPTMVPTTTAPPRIVMLQPTAEPSLTPDPSIFEVSRA